MPPMILKGIVTKVGCMRKTATVTVSRWTIHPKTHKRIERSKKYLTDDPAECLKLRDIVNIQNCPPVSARKRFRLLEILKSPETEWTLAHPELANAAREDEKQGTESNDPLEDEEQAEIEPQEAMHKSPRVNPLLAHLTETSTGNPLLPHTSKQYHPPSA